VSLCGLLLLLAIATVWIVTLRSAKERIGTRGVWADITIMQIGLDKGSHGKTIDFGEQVC
jgi:hypothetical protein